MPPLRPCTTLPVGRPGSELKTHRASRATRSITGRDDGEAISSSDVISPATGAGAPMTNTEAIGAVLYKAPFVFYLEAAGLILLVAMMGAIVLTLRHKPNVKRQSITAQNARNPETAIDIVKVPSGSYTVPEKAKERV